MNRTQFEWQADEEEKLGKSSQLPETNLGNRRRRFVLLFFLVLIVTSGLTYWSLSRRQHQLEENVRQDVKVSFNLWQEAVERKDGELYAHLLAAEDGNWQRVQKRLFENDLLLRRSFLGLSMQDEATATPNIQLAPDWQQATVSFEQSYAVAAVSDINGMVRLLHTAVYEIQDSNWLQAAPDENFWGDWQTDDGELLIVRYPERDARIVRRISRQLEEDLLAVCSEQEGGEKGAKDVCARVKPLVLKMSTEVGSLDALNTATGPMLYGRVYQLPTPTLVGLPIDEPSYHAFYQGYTRKLIEDVQTAVSTPVPLPKQVIRTLCFNHPSVGPRLYKYDPAQGNWESELPDRTFRFLEMLPDYEGVILHEIFDDREIIHSRLIQWNGGTEKLLLEDTTDEIPYRVLSSANVYAAPYLLLQRRTIGQTVDDYRWLDLQSCNEIGCDLEESPGYTLWSPGGQQALLLQGSNIHLIDKDGQIQVTIGTGFNPFWLDDKSFGYIHFAQRESGFTTEVLMVQTTAEGEQILFDSSDLANAAGIEEGDIFIRYVTVSPTDPNLLLINATGIRNYAGEYFIFSVGLPIKGTGESHRDINLHLQRTGSPGGELSLFTPTGFLPFLPSPDGRWLMISELTGRDSETWTFLLHDLNRNQTEIITDSFPFLPAQFPSYDWSSDGQWLVIADDGFFRLLAPEQEYDQMIPHDFDYCMSIKWSD